jgi:N-acetylmuramoyl-L-alanine amidase
LKWRIRKPIIWLTGRTKMKLSAIGAAILLVASILFYQPGFLHTWKHNHPLSHQIIVLDPGHGGYDVGAIAADGTPEARITLQITKQVRHYLQQAGATVYLTRERNQDLAGDGHVRNRKRKDLVRRYAYIQNKRAGLLLTIHMNAMVNTRWRGAQTFYNAHGHETNQALAEQIQQAFKLELANTTREAKAMSHPIYLLRKSSIPTALVECGFLSNPQEATLLKQNKYQRKVAFAIYQGVLRYAQQVGYNN